jgi:hypothetical protein
VPNPSVRYIPRVVCERHDAAPGRSPARRAISSFFQALILKKIALLTVTPRWPWARQTLGQTMRWGDCSFVVNPIGGRFDGCIVYDGLLSRASLECPPDKVFLVTCEPPSIKTYNEKFAAQFSAVVTCHSDLPHPCVILAQQAYPWCAGMNKNASDLGAAATSIDKFLTEPAPAKSRLLSVVVSDQAVTPAHRYRRTLVAHLRAHFGDDLEIFGRGIRDVGDKSEALMPFKYHIALENSSYFHYWTEKLADPFLCWTFPLYWGCPNIEEYFPEGAFRRINIYNLDHTVAVIEQAIKDDLYTKALPQLAEARRRILQEYNLFALAAKLCSAPTVAQPIAVRLHPEQFFRDHWTRKVRHRIKRALPRKWRKSKMAPLGATRD